jgi:hypothetical protein
VLDDDEICAFAGDGDDLDEICSRMVNEANARGGPDNITVVVVEVTGSGGTSAPRSRRHTRRNPRLPVRALIWMALIAAAAFGAIFVARTVTNNNFYVGVTGDEVAIFRGFPPEEIPRIPLRLVEKTGIKVSELPDWLGVKVRKGAPYKSLSEARAYVDDLRQSKPKPSASPTGEEP